MRKAIWIVLALGAAVCLAVPTRAVETNRTDATDLRERQRIVLTEMIALNRKIRILRDNAIKQDEFLRVKWEKGRLSEEEKEKAIARNCPEVVDMQAKWDQLQAEFKAIQKQLKSASAEGVGASEG